MCSTLIATAALLYIYGNDIFATTRTQFNRVSSRYRTYRGAVMMLGVRLASGKLHLGIRARLYTRDIGIRAAASRSGGEVEPQYLF